MDKFLEAAMIVVQSNFVYIPVVRPPDEAAAWRSDARWSLSAAVALGQLSEEDADATMNHFNGSW